MQQWRGGKAALPAADVAAVVGGGCRTVLEQTLPGPGCRSSAAAPGMSKHRPPCCGGTSRLASGPQLETQRRERQMPGRRTGLGSS